MKNVLHITPHLSGGVGAVLLSTLQFYKDKKYYKHEIIVFEKLLESEKKNFRGFLRCIIRTQKNKIIQDKINTSDIVQLEWWSHPLIYYFLIDFKFPKCRLLITSHIAGFYRPNLITKNIVNFSDIFLATTKVSSKLKIFTQNNKLLLKNKFDYIDYPINFKRFKNLKKKTHNTFNIGYVGTLDYAKLRKNFLLISSKIKINNVKFIICGNDLQNMIYKESLLFKDINFEFKGFVKNIKKIFQELDIFAYPLNSKHFGTGEQVLREAMYSALPIVAFNNLCESNIIQNNKTGILVNSDDEYIKTIEHLFENKKKRIKLGNNAKQSINKNLNPKKIFKKLELIYHKLLKKEKKEKEFKFATKAFNLDKYENIGAKIFIESLGHKNKDFYRSFVSANKIIIKKADLEIANIEMELKAKNKGSIYQYLRYFPKDKYLNYWAGIIKFSEKKPLEAKKYFKLSEFNQYRIQSILRILS